MSARSFAVTGAVVVGAAFAMSQVPIDPWSNHDLTIILPVAGVREQHDSTRLERLAAAFKNAKTVPDSTSIEAWRRALSHWQDSGLVNMRQFKPALECPMPVATDSTALPMPTARSGPVDVNMPVLKVPCFNPLFAGVKPDSQ